jgi:hypothetical protein
MRYRALSAAESHAGHLKSESALFTRAYCLVRRVRKGVSSRPRFAVTSAFAPGAVGATKLGAGCRTGG